MALPHRSVGDSVTITVSVFPLILKTLPLSRISVKVTSERSVLVFTFVNV